MKCCSDSTWKSAGQWMCTEHQNELYNWHLGTPFWYCIIVIVFITHLTLVSTRNMLCIRKILQLWQEQIAGSCILGLHNCTRISHCDFCFFGCGIVSIVCIGEALMSQTSNLNGWVTFSSLAVADRWALNAADGQTRSFVNSSGGKLIVTHEPAAAAVRSVWPAIS